MVVATCPGLIAMAPAFALIIVLSVWIFRRRKSDKDYKFFKLMMSGEDGLFQTLPKELSFYIKNGLRIAGITTILILTYSAYLVSPMACTPVSADEPPNCTPREILRDNPSIANTTIHFCPDKKEHND